MNEASSKFVVADIERPRNLFQEFQQNLSFLLFANSIIIWIYLGPFLLQ